MKLMLAAATAATALLLAPAANATPSQDAEFRQRLDNAGIAWQDSSALAPAADWVCKQFALGNGASAIARQVWLYSGLDQPRANLFVSIATDIYCPRFNGMNGGSWA